MCQFLLEKGCASGIAKTYDATGLFVHSVQTYFEEASTKCKNALQGLMAFICQMHGQRDGVESRVHEKVMDWLAEPSDPILVGVGAKVMSFIVNDKVTHIFPLNEQSYVRMSSVEPVDFNGCFKTMMLFDIRAVERTSRTNSTFSMQIL